MLVVYLQRQQIACVFLDSNFNELIWMAVCMTIVASDSIVSDFWEAMSTLNGNFGDRMYTFTQHVISRNCFGVHSTHLSCRDPQH